MTPTNLTAVALAIFTTSYAVAFLLRDEEIPSPLSPALRESGAEHTRVGGDRKESFLRVARLHENDLDLSPLYSEMYAWARGNARQAWEFLESDQLPPDIKGKMISLVMDAACETDPDVAIEMMDKYSSLSGSGGGGGWFTRNPAAGFSLLLATPDGSLGNGMLQTVVKAWLKKDQRAVLERLLSDDIPENKRGEIEEALVEGLVESDLQAAADLVVGLKRGKNTVRGLARDVVQKMAESDPVDALQWVTKHFRAEAAHELAAIVVRKISEDDPLLAVEMAYELPSGNATGYLRESALQAWISSEKNVKEAEKWARNLKDPKARDSAYNQIGYSWVKIDREKAIAYVGDAPDSEIENGFIEAIAHSLVSKDHPMDVKGWITNLPQDRAVVAARSYVGVISYHTPQEAVEFARSFTDPVVRESALKVSAETYLDRDPAGLARWFDTLDQETADIVMAEIERIDPTSRTRDRKVFDAALSTQ